VNSRLVDKTISAPITVTWEITTGCNLSCVHCLSSFDDRRISELTTNECFNLIDQLANLNVFRINFGGGEPFIRSDFMQLLKYADSKGIITCISTNGTMLDKKMVRSFKEFGEDNFFIQISLDGASAETNDKIRGKGTFEQIIKAIKLLSNEHLEFTINTVLTSINYGEMMDLYQLAKANNGKLRVSRLRPSGKGKENWSRLALSREQMEAFPKFLNAFDDVLTGDSFFFLSTESRQKLGLNMCGAAKLTCSIAPDGKIYPCPFLQEPEFEAGDIRKENFADIWKNGTALELFRHRNVDACHTCYRLDSCHGGCPAVGYYISKSLNEPDPECILINHD
jgi:mycofactocin biosynthetic radical S-adenosylmethionine protein MftC